MVLPAFIKDVAIRTAAIDSTIWADVDIDLGPLWFRPCAMPLSTINPIELEKKLLVREDVPGPTGGFTGVDLTFVDHVLNIQDVTETPLSPVREMEAHPGYSEIPKDKWRE